LPAFEALVRPKGKSSRDRTKRKKGSEAMKSFVTTRVLFAALMLAPTIPLNAQVVATGTLYGTGQGVGPGGRDAYWDMVALPTGFTPPNPLPYDAYVPTATPGVFIGGGNPQTGVAFSGIQNYWIAPQNTTASLQPFGLTYNWIVKQQFTLSQAGFYRFDFPGAGDNELEFYIDGSIDSTDPYRPTISGGTQIGARAGGFGSIYTFTGGAQLSAGTHNAYMVLWDYGGDTAALIGQSVFSPTVAYWAPSAGAGGSGTWTTSGTDWAVDAAGTGSKSAWSAGVGVGYFGGTSGTVSVGGGGVTVNKMFFTTNGYTVQSGGGNITYENGALITAETGTVAITATQLGSNGVSVTGPGVVRFDGNSFFSAPAKVTNNGQLQVNGYVSSGVTVTSGTLDGIGTIGGDLAGAGVVNPGPTNGVGILTAGALAPTTGLDLSFVFSGSAPNYGSASSSVNDLVRLTGGTPFSAPLSSANNISIYFDSITDPSQFAVGSKFTGAFFADADASFLPSVQSARYSYYVYGDGNGPYSHNGRNYYSIDTFVPGFTSTYNVGVGVETTTANFSSGSSLGQVTTFTVVVPEPSTYCMALAGLACGGYSMFRRRKRA
jgi:hypothetical protein